METNRYNSGVSNEIYAADFPDDMVGMRFDRAAEIVYVELRATLIAVQSSPDYRSRMSRSTMAPSRRGESQVSRVTRVSRVSMLSDCSDIHSDPRVQLYPSDYHIRPGDMAILICHHQNAATQVRTGDMRMVLYQSMRDCLRLVCVPALLTVEGQNRCVQGAAGLFHVHDRQGSRACNETRQRRWTAATRRAFTHAPGVAAKPPALAHEIGLPGEGCSVGVTGFHPG